MSETVSPALARRVALAAQGFGRLPASARSDSKSRAPGIRQLRSLVERLGLLQIDSVNVFERTHYLPAFARLGAYDKTLLDRLTYGRSSPFTEYWAHEASFLPLESWPLMRWRMDAYRARSLADTNGWSNSNGAMLTWLLSELAEKGPLPASAIEHDANKRRGPWWGWSDVKRGLETLFRWGDVVSAGRQRFERTYALPGQVLPSELLAYDISRADAHRQLVAIAARAHGIGTAKDIADYFRLKTVETNRAILELEEQGELVPVGVHGWRQKAWLHKDARLARRIETIALLSPFDPVVWERQRTERMFGFRYRIEIYTPAPKRTYGYYVLPVLLDDRIVGRVDLKSDRQAGVLRVQAAWAEPEAPPELAERLALLLRQTAAWQGLTDVVVAERGDLARVLEAELAGH